MGAVIHDIHSDFSDLGMNKNQGNKEIKTLSMRKLVVYRI